MFVAVAFVRAAAVMSRFSSRLYLSILIIHVTVDGRVWCRCQSCAWMFWSVSWNFPSSIFSVFLSIILWRRRYLGNFGIPTTLGNLGSAADCFLVGVIAIDGN